VKAPRRRGDDPRSNPEADEIERFYGSLPRVIEGLRRGRRQNRFIAVFGLTALLLFSWRLQVQQVDIRAAASADRQSSYEQCQVANENALALNRFLDQVIDAVRASDGLTRGEKAKRVRAYQSIKQALPVCAKP
jgi:hypothetical protein